MTPRKRRWPIERIGRALVALAIGVVGASRSSAGDGKPDPAASLPAKVAEQRRLLAAQFDRGHRYALLVGINQFDDAKSLPPLRFCVADATLLADVLVKRCGYPAENITLLADGQPPDRLPTKDVVLATLNTMLKKAQPGDTVLVYISCHGGETNGQSHVCPKDFDGASPGLTYISVEFLRDQLQACTASQKLLVLDACHSGASSAAGGATVGLGGDITKSLLAGGLITFAAAAAKQSAQEDVEIRHGFFTYYLAAGLGGAADRDGDGIVDSDELYSHVLADVSAAVGRRGGVQTPVRIIGGDVVGVFALARVAGEAYLVPEMKAGERLRNSIGMELSLVMPGSFVEGSPDDESGRKEDEVQRTVTIGHPYFLGIHEVTQGEYAAVTGKNPSWFQKSGGGTDAVGDMDTSQFPVEQTSFEDAMEYCRRLSATPAEATAGRTYRLPTEAEWEYACRAGTTTAFHAGALLSSKAANVDGTKPYLNSDAGPALKRTTTVGSYPPNAWGFFDMHGNVAEWCSDLSGEYRMKGSKVIEPSGAEQGKVRMVKGGAYSGDVALCRSAARRDRAFDLQHKSTGFRVVCTAR